MSWSGKPCPFTIQILIKISIFKVMAIYGTLVCDTWFVLSSGVFYSCVWSNFSRAPVTWQGHVLRQKVETFYIFIGYLSLQTDKIVKFVTNIIKFKLKNTDAAN